MNNFSSFAYCFHQGIKNINRNKLFSIASVATMTACLFLFGVMYFLLVNVRFMLLEAETNVGITAFFDEGTTQAQIDELKVKIENYEEVKSVTYKSAEETWAEYKETHLTDELANTFGDDNPLEDSASFTIFFKSVDRQQEMAQKIAGLKGIRKVNDTEDLVKSLKRMNRILSIGSVAIIGLLLFIATFLISTTVTMGVSIRRREISIMHLIGATDIFVRAPFLVEGIIIGLLGACIPLSVLYALYYKIIELIANKFSSLFNTLNFVKTSQVFGVLAPVCICIGVGIGFLGSYFTLNKQLRKIRQL